MKALMAGLILVCMAVPARAEDEPTTALFKSLDSLDGWRLHKWEQAIVNDKAKLVIAESGKVYMWYLNDPQREWGPQLTEFDPKVVQPKYKEARKKLILRQLEPEPKK